MAKGVIWDFLPDGSAPPKSITTSVHRKHTTQISTVYKQCVHCRIYFPSLYFLYVEKKNRKKNNLRRVEDRRTAKFLWSPV